MRIKLIITANGPDRKGIVSEISSIIGHHNCNIETSKMVRLENEFSMLILIEAEKTAKKSLYLDLKKIKDLKFEIIETKKNHDIIYENKFHLYINGADNEGIVYQFSNYLSKMNINIEEINTDIKNAPVSATPLFMMDVIIGSKKKINEKKIMIKLNKIAEKLGVEVKLKTIE